MNIATLILAAGNSSRMGKAKQLLAVEDSTLLGMAIKNALKSDTDEVFCVLGENINVILKSIEKFEIGTIVNPNYEDGLSSSIVCGIERLMHFDAVFVMLADQPKVDSSYLNQIIFDFKDNPGCIIASDYEGTKGVPALFPKEYYHFLLKLKGDKGAKQLLNSKKITVKTVNTSVNLLDIDTPEDYHNLINNLNNDSI